MIETFSENGKRVKNVLFKKTKKKKNRYYLERSRSIFRLIATNIIENERRKRCFKFVIPRFNLKRSLLNSSPVIEF